MTRNLPFWLRRCVAAALLGAATVPLAAHAQAKQQDLVDRATLTVQDMLDTNQGPSAEGLIQRARAVLICPRAFSAAFIFGGQYGGCVLAARDGAGSWSYPAFYKLGSGSFGFQIGLEDQELMMMILTQKGLNAIMNSQFKIGVDGGVTVATLSVGAEAATTAALRADIVALGRSRGLYGGISLSGSLLSNDEEADNLYYGQDLGAHQIVVSMQGRNSGADPLREALTRVGSSLGNSNQPAYAPAQHYDQPPATSQQPQQDYNAPVNAGPQQLSPVQQQNLPAPR